MREINDQEIRQGIMSGNEIIIRWFYQKNFPIVKNYILRKGGCLQDAEDVFQDALLLLYLKLRKSEFTIRTPIQNYFYGVCRNMWLKRVNRNKKLLFMDLLNDYLQYEESTIIDQIFQKDRKHLFHTYFLNLKDSTKKIWQLIFEGKDYEEIAEITGCTENYLRKKKSETKKSMIQSISKDPVFKELVKI